MADQADEQVLRLALRALALSQASGSAPAVDDPVQRLLARAAAERDFVAVGKRWADEHGVTVSAFLDEGVPADLLSAAGFEFGRSHPDQSAADRAALHQSIWNAMPAHQPFTIEGLAVRADKTRRVVQQAVDRAVEEGILAVVAVSEVQGRPGLASFLYRRR
jgi:hypothetical protein